MSAPSCLRPCCPSIRFSQLWPPPSGSGIWQEYSWPLQREKKMKIRNKSIRMNFIIHVYCRKKYFVSKGLGFLSGVMFILARRSCGTLLRWSNKAFALTVNGYVERMQEGPKALLKVHGSLSLPKTLSSYTTSINPSSNDSFIFSWYLLGMTNSHPSLVEGGPRLSVTNVSMEIISIAQRLTVHTYYWELIDLQ